MKKLLMVLIALFGVLPLFAKSYKYEEQERWCFALGSYYDALQTKEAPENKREACEGYAKLRDAIKAGKPGFSKYDDFTINDEWEKLIIDAEKYFSSICRFDIEYFSIDKDSVQMDFQTKSKTATYVVKIWYKEGQRYETIMSIVRQGLKTMIDFYTNEYSNFKLFDNARDWPKYSVSHKENRSYNANGALVYEYRDCYNAFYCNLYKFLVNIVDENGKELVKGRQLILDEDEKTKGYQIVFSGVSQEVADLIDSDKARVNIAACYLAYGKYNSASDKGGRSFVNSLPEVQISMDKRSYNVETLVYTVLLDKGSFSDEFVTINGYDYKFKMLKTEVTQRLYRIIMAEDHSQHEGECNPVNNVSWYEAVYFCNKLSQRLGYEPVYSVNGETDVAKWGYARHYDESINGEIAQNLKANGFRLPTKSEWLFAVKDGNQHDYGWNEDFWELRPVAQKEPNGYGLYDMYDNVWEWVWGVGVRGRDYRYIFFGEKTLGESDDDIDIGADEYDDCIGFRVVRTLAEGAR